MRPLIRKIALTAHISFSVGWLGAVIVFLILAISGITNSNDQVVKSIYLTMELIGWLVILPLSLSALITGFIQSLGTHWGLFKHYWVIAKLLLTIFAVAVLFIHLQPISYLAEISSKSILSINDLIGLRIQLIADAGAALLVLIACVILSVYKPWGKTAYGLGKMGGETSSAFAKPKYNKMLMMFIILGTLLALIFFIVLHIVKGNIEIH
jgi:hypothetical protein